MTSDIIRTVIVCYCVASFGMMLLFLADCWRTGRLQLKREMREAIICLVISPISMPFLAAVWLTDLCGKIVRTFKERKHDK